MVLDFHGQFADPQGTYMQLIHPTVLDAAKGLPFSPFECTREEGMGSWKATSYALADIFAYVTGLGMAQRDVVQTAIQDAYKAHGFENGDAADLEYPTPQEVLKRVEQKEQMRHVSNVSVRCRPLLEMDLFRPVRGASDMLSSIRRGLVIDLHNLYAETLQLAAGAFVLRKLYRDMFTWGYADRIRLAIVLDEAHRLARDVTLPKIMKEGRKFGIAVIVASQGIGDFHQDILGNAGTKVIFRVNYPDSKKVSGFIRGRQGQDIATRIEQLSVGSAYVQTPDMAFGSMVQMYPLE
jgi:DNA phosphorothioation-dependent restriction protein DptH